MSRNVKRVVDRLISAVALLGITVVPIVYVVGTVSMQRQINALEAQVDYMTEMVVNEIRQNALAEVTEDMPVGMDGFEEQEEQEAPQHIIPVAEGEAELLVRLVIVESGKQPYEGQVSVAQGVCARYIDG